MQEHINKQVDKIADAEDGVYHLQNAIVDQKEEYDDTVE